MNPKSAFDEILAAALGCWGILTGNRIASNRVPSSLSDVATSFIPLLVVLAFVARLVTIMLGDVFQSPTVFLFLELLVSTIAGFAGVYWFLKIRGHSTDISQYIVAHNWATAFTVLLLVITVFILPGLIVVVLVGAASFIFYMRSADLLLGVRIPDFLLMMGAQVISAFLITNAFVLLTTPLVSIFS